MSGNGVHDGSTYNGPEGSNGWLDSVAGSMNWAPTAPVTADRDPVPSTNRQNIFYSTLVRHSSGLTSWPTTAAVLAAGYSPKISRAGDTVNRRTLALPHDRLSQTGHIALVRDLKDGSTVLRCAVSGCHASRDLKSYLCFRGHETDQWRVTSSSATTGNTKLKCVTCSSTPQTITIWDTNEHLYPTEELFPQESQ